MMDRRGLIAAAIAVLGLAVAFVLLRPATPGDCETAQCRQDAVLAAWTSDRERSLAMVAALPEEVERIAAISALVDLYPTEVGALCDLLPSGYSKKRCTLASTREHLHVSMPSVIDWDRSAKGDPRGEQWSGLQYISPLASVAPDSGRCSEKADPNACRLHHALRHAEEGRIERAAALCMAIPLMGDPPEQWRSECFFEAAERHLRAYPVEGYEHAADLCSASSLYGAFCQRQLMVLGSRTVPAADETNPAGWKKMSRFADVVAAKWADPKSASVLVSGLWGVALKRSMDATTKVSGDVIDQAPQAALPHIRAAAAARMMTLSQPETRGLHEWVEAVEHALTLRSRHPARGTIHGKFRPIRPVWPHGEAEAAGMPLIQYVGTSLRVLSDDPRTDMAICVLEAAGRSEPVPKALLVEGTAHSDAGVRYTATAIMNRYGMAPP
jgi:hypothetical protein